jgi:hypothetical protein
VRASFFSISLIHLAAHLMTQPESPESIPESPQATARAATVEPAGESEPEEPQPEPLTPERVSEWNAYYDLYVTLGVLLLAFVVSANKITHSSIWSQLQTGRIIAANKAPVTKDLFSYTEEGASWVNVPWLFEWGHALAYKAAYDLTPAVPDDPAATTAKAEQIAAGTLVAINALARLLTAVVLLGIRRAGPGKWWSAFCVTLALGAVFNPIRLLPVLGGIAGPGAVSPMTWGLLLLALELLLLHRAFVLGKAGSLYALVPLFALWANVDESFVIGLFVLAAAAVGRVRPEPRAKDEPSAPGVTAALVVLAASALACLANPSLPGVYGAGLAPLLGLFRRTAGDVVTVDQLSYFGNGLGEAWKLLIAYYTVLVAAGFASFLLNRRRFSLSRCSRSSSPRRSRSTARSGIRTGSAPRVVSASGGRSGRWAGGRSRSWRSSAAWPSR